VFCIDIDTKHDIVGGVVKDYADLIKEQAPTLLDRLVVEKTPSGGYHFVGRCESPIRNLKLAKNKNHEAIIETRGDGGYFCAAPTPDYKLQRGTFEAIAEISPDELEILLDCARALNQEEKELPAPTGIPHHSGGVTPFDAYDARTTPGETVALLESHGWKVMARGALAGHPRGPGAGSSHVAVTV